MAISFGQAAELGEGVMRAAHSHFKLLGFAGGALDLAFNVGIANRGEVIQSGAGSLAGTTTSILAAELGSAIGAALPIPGASFALGLVGGLVGDPLGRTSAAKAVTGILNAGKSMTHGSFGNGYTDTDYAYTMRQRAAQQMGSSLLNARQFLGKEARLFHS